MADKSFCTGGSTHIGDRDGFDPTRKTINHGEEIRVAFRGWQRTNQVQVDMVKAGSRRRIRAQRSLDVTDDLRTLARVTLPNIFLDCSAHPRPDKTSGDVTERSVATLMS